jgi:hypothetical protein
MLTFLRVFCCCIVVDPSSISTDVDGKGRLSTSDSSESGSEMCYEI